jgi:hypothetical protein
MPRPTSRSSQSRAKEELRSQALALSKLAPQELALYLAQLDDTVEDIQALRRETLRLLRWSAPTYAELYAELAGMDPLF